ncbi:MAG: NERD domain-containing protein [Pseudomonadota bacterium]
MDLDALTTAGTLAVVTATAFLLAAKLWNALGKLAAGNPFFPNSTMREAAQRFRDEFEHLRRKQANYLAATLVLAIIFLVAFELEAQGLYHGYPHWQLSLLIAALLATAACFLYKIGATLLGLRKLRLRRDANIAIGHQLQRLAARQGAVFHDVELAGEVIDHVVVGSSGAYAVHVIARRNRRQRSATLKDEQLSLGDEETLVLYAASKRALRLAAALGKLAGNPVTVRSVVAIPGWEIAEQQSQKHLLVNERTLPMLSGWKSSSDYLMNEDVVAIQEYLTDAGKRRA